MFNVNFTVKEAGGGRIGAIWDKSKLKVPFCCRLLTSDYQPDRPKLPRYISDPSGRSSRGEKRENSSKAQIFLRVQIVLRYILKAPNAFFPGLFSPRPWPPPPLQWVLTNKTAAATTVTQTE